MFFVLEYTNSPAIIGGLSYQESSIGCDWLEGMKLASVPEQMFVTIENSPAALPDYFDVADAPVVSGDFINALSSAGADNFEAYPVLVEINGQALSGFFALNIIGRVSALDQEKSDYVLDTSEDPEDLIIMRMKSMALKSEFIQSFHLFRLDEYQDVIIISESVKNKISALTGVKVSPAQGWSDSHRF
ncbi:Imm43 family immunity protein [Thalassomonas haliotis]|uniref:Immunity MXAN-0049 protein domain-containing protein n=1 Tax=Thalassomonas haliotis TaxID=485448 RepID=A0ABY7VKW8_9GAMM|nr:DUF1629 domain-containing protein [Thalassomonas haliotis]WDE14160.1 hypothetical protein H3N35_12540 [Thalassomonas haliotis]